MFVLGEAEVVKLADQQGDGIEAAARAARYSFFQEAAPRLGARYVVTGHTADDQAETVLFNLLRGTGLSGLAGIPRVRSLGPAVSLIRPMLSIRRCEVISYLAEIQQDYCVDPTNASSDFARNRIRHELLPLVRREFNHDIEGALCRLSQLVGDAQRVIEKLADELLDRCVSQDKKLDAVVVNSKPLVEADRHLIRELFIALWRRERWPLQDMGFNEWEMLATMAADGAALTKRIFPGGVVVERLPNGVRLRRE
jgi:tRNA(Ile)-lysidine synthase